MGFSSALQGSSSHDAFLLRQDAEVRLLENMRRSLQLRVKTDREYSVGLNSFLMQAQKMNIESGGELVGSQIARTWNTFIEETDRMAKLVKENADYLASSVLDKLNSLYTEKKANRKFYQEEHSRICSELSRLQEAVNRTRNDYEKCQDNFATVKTKFEDQCTKGKSGKRFDDLRERYQKACRKLHTTHNDYVLLLCEASEFERDMRTILLPGLLEHQQAIQEDMVEKWKIMLQDVQRCCNLASKKCQDMQLKIESSLTAIKSSEEYNKFIDANKTSPPVPTSFKFDPLLLDEKLGINLSPNAVALDDLTIDSLKNKLHDNEQRLTECKAQIKDKQTLIIQYNTELETVKFKSDVVSVGRMFAVKKTMDLLKKEVNELRCTEQKLTKQNELIQTPLAELGCEQAPLGCDVSGSVGDVSTIDLAAPVAPLKTKRGSQQVMSLLLKKPFSSGKKTASSNSISQNNSALDNSDFESSVTSSANNIEVITPTVDANANNGEGNANANSEQMLNPEGSRLLEEEVWFHGVLPRGEVVRLLVKDGDFLVRETTRNDEKQIVLSVMWGAPKHFIVQTSPDGMFRFEGPAFPTVQELIMHQFQSETSVTSRSGAILKNPVLREEWELNNDDVELVEKIGRGNFGDVYKATLRPNNHCVAVKTCKVTLPEEQKKKFLQEGRILKQYDHPNIVRFIGICVQKQPIMIVMELVPGGSLLNYLRNNGTNLTSKQMLGMCLDASAGMQYLESKNCIHRDLAARNCLVGEGNGVKISDFGMSREEEEYTVSDGLKQIPIKWTAPEALNYGKYTSLCDVWSYGVLCWEIFSKGGTPYQGMTNTRAREMLDSGYRMPAPEGTPEDMYKLMLRCWQYDPEDRPHFPEIHNNVELLYSRAAVGPETRV